MAITIRIDTEGTEASERSIRQLEAALASLDLAQAQASVATHEAVQALNQIRDAQSEAGAAVDVYTDSVAGSAKGIDYQSEALREAMEAQRRATEEVERAVQAEEDRGSAIGKGAMALAKFVGAHFAIHAAMKQARGEGIQLQNAYSSARRVVTSLTLASAGASVALTRLRDMTNEVGTAASAALGPLRSFMDWLTQVRRLTLVLAGAGGLGLLTKWLVEIGASAGNIRQVQGAFDQLAASVGTTGDALRGRLRNAVAGTVSDVELMESAVLALNSGAIKSSDDLVELAASARVLGRTVNLDTAKALDNLVRAIGLQNSSLLKSVTVITSVDQANREYQQRMGLVGEVLDENQQKEAFRLSVMDRVREGVLRVADTENLRSETLDRLRGELDRLDPLSKEYERTLRDISVETSRLIAGTDDLGTRLERLSANFQNQANATRLVISENKQLVGVVKDIEEAMEGGSAAGNVWLGTVDAMTTAVAGLTRVLARVGPLLAVWLGWRVIGGVMTRAAAGAMALHRAIQALTGARAAGRAALMFGVKGLLVAGVASAIYYMARMRGEAVAAAAAVAESMERIQQSIDDMDFETSGATMAVVAAMLERARRQQEIAKAAVDAAESEMVTVPGPRGFGTMQEPGKATPAQLEALRSANEDVQQLGAQFEHLVVRFQALSQEQFASAMAGQSWLDSVRARYEVTMEAWRGLKDAYDAEEERLKDLRREHLILRTEMNSMDAGTEAFEEASESLKRMNEQLEGSERRLRSIGGLASGVAQNLTDAFMRSPASQFSPGMRGIIGAPPPWHRPPKWMADASSFRRMFPEAERASETLNSVTTALSEMHLTGQVTEAILAAARAQLAAAGITAEQIDDAFSQFGDGSAEAMAQLDQARASTIAAFGAMAQAAVRGSDQMAQSVISGLTQIIQAANFDRGPIFGAWVGAVGGLMSALFSRRNREPQPVRLEEYSPKALTQRERREGPDRLVLVLQGHDGDISRTEYELKRRSTRDAVARVPLKGGF